MKQIILITLLLFSFAAFAQNKQDVPICILPIEFDVFEKLPWNDEKARFDNLFAYISENKNSKSLIVLKFNKTESKGRKTKKLKEIAKHFELKKIDKTKFILAIFEDKEERTTFWVEPEDFAVELLLASETGPFILIKGTEIEKKLKNYFQKIKNYNNRNKNESRFGLTLRQHCLTFSVLKSNYANNRSKCSR